MARDIANFLNVSGLGQNMRLEAIGITLYSECATEDALVCFLALITQKKAHEESLVEKNSTIFYPCRTSYLKPWRNKRFGNNRNIRKANLFEKPNKNVPRK